MTADLVRLLGEHRPTATEFCAGCDWTPVGINGWREMDERDLHEAHLAGVVEPLLERAAAEAAAGVKAAVEKVCDDHSGMHGRYRWVDVERIRATLADVPAHLAVAEAAEPENCRQCAGTGRNYHYGDECEWCGGTGIAPTPTPDGVPAHPATAETARTLRIAAAFIRANDSNDVRLTADYALDTLADEPDEWRKVVAAYEADESGGAQ